MNAFVWAMRIETAALVEPKSKTKGATQLSTGQGLFWVAPYSHVVTVVGGPLFAYCG